MAVIYAFGDSITYGAWDMEGSGWAARLRRYFDELQEKDPELYVLFYNLGIPGETTAGLVKRFDLEFEARKRGEKGEESIFIFAYGANDSAYLKEKGMFRVSKEDYIRNLEAVISKAMKVSPKILLVNVTPITESLNSVPRNGKVRLNSYVQEFNAVLADLAVRLKLPLVDVYSKFTNAGHEGLLDADDGLHPNADGHKVIFNSLKDRVRDLL